MIPAAEASRSELPFDAERLLRILGLQLFLAGTLSLFGARVWRYVQHVTWPAELLNPLLIVIGIGLILGLESWTWEWEGGPPSVRRISLGVLLFLWLLPANLDAYDRIADRVTWSEHEQLTGAFTVIGLLLMLSNDRERELLRWGQHLSGTIRSFVRGHVRGTLAGCLLTVCLLNDRNAGWGCHKASIFCERIGLYVPAIGFGRLERDVFHPLAGCGTCLAQMHDEQSERIYRLEQQWARAWGLEPDAEDEPTAPPNAESTAHSIRRPPPWRSASRFD